MPDLSPVLVTFGQYIRAERKELGWSQLELARKAGVTVESLRSYEKGTRQAGVLQALAIADALGAPLGEMLSPSSCGNCGGTPRRGYRCAECGRERAR